MDIVKRRINRIKKENQVYVHKVHLLCWIAHGNYVNKVLCNENLMGLSLSLLPSQKSYPPQRLDISYLQEMLQWYRKTISITQPTNDTKGRLEEILEKQIMHKKTYDYKNFVYIFICLLRSLGIKCRLMLSLQVEPLRPATTELCSLSQVNPSSSKSNGTVNKIIHEAKNTPGNSAKKKNTSKVISTKKVSHIKSKSNKLKDFKTKKLDFEDLCLLESVNEKRSSNISIKPSLNKTNENSKPSKSDIEQANLSERQIREKKLRAGYNKAKTEESIGNDLTAITKHSKGIKQQPENVSKTCENKSTSCNTKKTKDKRSTQKNKKYNTKEEVKDPRNKGDGENQDHSSSVERKCAEKEIPRNRRNDKNAQKTNKLEIPLRRSQRLSKSPENINETSVSPDNITKSSKSYGLDSKTKVNLNAFRVKMPFKLNSASSKNSGIKTTDEIEKSPSVGVVSEKLMKSDIPQLDGGNDDTDSASETTRNRRKPSLKQLKNNPSKCPIKQHPKRLRNTIQYKEIDSDEDFRNSNVSPHKVASLKKSPEKKSGKSNRNIGVAGLKNQDTLNFSLSDATSRHFKHAGGKIDVRNDIINLMKKNISKEKSLLRSKLVKHKRTSKSYSDSDSDYMPESVKKKPLESDFKEKSMNVKRRIPMKKDLIEIEKKKQAEKEEEKKKKGVNVWIEVFAEAEEKWISIDVVKGQIHCVKEIYTRATHPVSYILSWDNEHHIKDLTKRYCPNWNTITRKLRVDDKWWNETLSPYKSFSNARDREEDEELARQQLEQPLPTTISEYKNHPLYVLKRHLLKFEALYPPDVLILGFVRNEPVYSRECVHVLHSREIWLKHAKVVKPGETPYKIVKSRPKYDKLSNSIITDQPLEIFGNWQVEDYVPPTAENGIVPRNAYGNVELFKPSMLPKGTVHLQLPGLNKVARKMNIDCAPAVVGFDFHGGWNHPTYDGFIVCEEFSEQLIAGWYQEQEESEKRAQEKLEKRVYDNWRRLIRGLLIRERLKAKYDFGEGPISSKDGKSKKKSLALKKRKVCSDSDSE